MPDGPGKYDDLATIVREQAAAEGVIVIVVNGAAGNGFSVQTRTPDIAALLPRLLRLVADEIERSVAVVAPDGSSNHERIGSAVSKTTTLYIAVSPHGAMAAPTVADQADRAWRKLCQQVSDPEVLHERGWRVGQLHCELVDIAE